MMGENTVTRAPLSGWARIAAEAWESIAPTAYGLIEDPKTFFSRLGARAEQRIEELSIQMQGIDRPDETPFQKAGRINQARMAAAEIVRAEMIEPPQDLREEPDEEEGETPEEIQSWHDSQNAFWAGTVTYYLLPWNRDELPDPEQTPEDFEDPDLYQRLYSEVLLEREERDAIAAMNRAELITRAKQYLGLS